MAETPFPTSSNANGPERRRHPRYNMALDVAFGSAHPDKPGVGGFAGTDGSRPPKDYLERTGHSQAAVGRACRKRVWQRAVGGDL